MTQHENRTTGPVDPLHRDTVPNAPAASSSKTGLMVIVIAILALGVGVVFFGGGAERAIVPDATLPISTAPSGDSVGAIPVTPAAPAGGTQSAPAN